MRARCHLIVDGHNSPIDPFVPNVNAGSF